MKVSVIIPTYNRCKQLTKTIESVFKQRYPNIEIIIVDDGSTDNTREIVLSIRDDRLKYIYRHHSGLPSSTRNSGIRAASGDWIAFLDSDDLWDTSKLSRQIEFMIDQKLEISCTNARVSGINSLEEMHSNPPGYLSYKNLSETNWVICSSVVVSKSLLDKVSYFPENNIYRAFEDWILWLRLSTAANIGFLNESLVTYNDNPSESIRFGLSLETSLLNKLRTDIITWGIKKIVSHPSRLRLIKSMWFARKYLYKSRS